MAPGVTEAALEEEVDEGGGGLKWGLRREIDVDGENEQLITIGIDPSGLLYYSPVFELHHPNMGTLWFHGGRLEIER